MAKINRDSKNVCNDALPAGMDTLVSSPIKLTQFIMFLLLFVGFIERFGEACRGYRSYCSAGFPVPSKLLNIRCIFGRAFWDAVLPRIHISIDPVAEFFYFTQTAAGR
jgi:hypothetical protein